MEKLDQCPCGAAPVQLHVTTTEQGRRWATVAGDCCDQWTIDFATDGLTDAEIQDLAIQIWNTAPRRWKRKEDG